MTIKPFSIRINKKMSVSRLFILRHSFLFLVKQCVTFYFLTLLTFHKSLTNRTDNKTINNPDRIKEVLPRMNDGSTVISITLTIIETKTNRNVRLIIIKVTSLFDRLIITILDTIWHYYLGKTKNIPTKKIKTPTDRIR